MARKTKVCLVASCGGHIMELMQLLPVVEGKDYYFVTERNVASEGMMAKHRHYYLKQQQRRGKSFAFTFAWNIILSFVYFVWERPTTVISTGAGASFPTMRLAKLFGAKVIYVESFAKLTNSSVTGRLAYRIADDFLVQWPEMKKVYPKATYSGTVY